MIMVCTIRSEWFPINWNNYSEVTDKKVIELSEPNGGWMIQIVCRGDNYARAY